MCKTLQSVQNIQISHLLIKAKGLYCDKICPKINLNSLHKVYTYTLARSSVYYWSVYAPHVILWVYSGTHKKKEKKTGLTYSTYSY